MEIIQVMLSSERVRVGLGDIAVICAFRMQVCAESYFYASGNCLVSVSMRNVLCTSSPIPSRVGGYPQRIGRSVSVCLSEHA